MQEFGSGKQVNVMYSEVRVYHAKKSHGEFTGELGRLKRIEPVYPTSGRAKSRKHQVKF